MTTRAVKKDALGLATKRAEKLLEEKAVQFLWKKTEGQRDSWREARSIVNGALQRQWKGYIDGQKLAEEDAEQLS